MLSRKNANHIKIKIDEEYDNFAGITDTIYLGCQIKYIFLSEIVKKRSSFDNLRDETGHRLGA